MDEEGAKAFEAEQQKIKEERARLAGLKRARAATIVQSEESSEESSKEASSPARVSPNDRCNLIVAAGEE